MRYALFLILISTVAFSGIIHISSDYVVPEEKEITYSGSVVVFIEEDNVHLRASTLVIRKVGEEWREMEAFGEVFIETESVQATSASLTYDVKGKNGRLLGNAIAYLKDEDATALSEAIDFDLSKDVYSSNEISTFLRKSVVATSNSFTYDGSKVRFEGDFRAEREKTRIYGDAASIDLERDLMEVSSATVLTEDATVSGDALVYDMEREGTFTGNVEALIKHGDERIRVIPEVLWFDTEKEEYSGEGDKVKIWKGKVYSESRKFTYVKSDGKLFLENEVYVYDKEKDVKMWAEKVVVYIDEDRMEAYRAKTEIQLK